jgi:hypothetical protein
LNSTHTDLCEILYAGLAWENGFPARYFFLLCFFLGGPYIREEFFWLRTSSLVGPFPFLNASAPSKARGPALEFSGTVFKGDTWLGVLSF